MHHLISGLVAVLFLASPLAAQTGPVQGSVQDLLQANRAMIEKSSRKTIQPVIDLLVESELPQVPQVLQKWQAREIWQRKNDALFFYGSKVENNVYRLFDLDSSEPVGDYPKKDIKQIKPNSGVRALIGTALVRFQLSDPDAARRIAALVSIQRTPAPEHLPALHAALKGEPDAQIMARKQRLITLLTIRFGPDDQSRIHAINEMSGDLGIDVRAALNPVLTTTVKFFKGAAPDAENIATHLAVGTGIPVQDAYARLVAAGIAPAEISPSGIRNALASNIVGERAGGVPLVALTDPGARLMAYDALAAAGSVPARTTIAQRDTMLAEYVFFDAYNESSRAVTDAARKVLDTIETKVAFNQALDLGLDALSLASIYFLAAIGLAITFGVMGVINMAHGEFIMMGAYTGFVVQQIIPDHTVSIIVALPVAFAVTFAAGVAMERLVIRWLYHRPLETLLATFGISIALQQIAKNIFGTQARPLTSPGWLDGSWVLNDVVSISYIRIAIFVLALLFLALFLFIMKRTRFGLETRAVTQNPRMASGMGINSDRVNMLTFGLGSGIAGVAGVAIGLYAKVTSDLGSDYIVQSFMTVVVGGVGNIWGALLGATMIGFLQKGIEWFNPSNTLAAQTYMIIFIIIFIQFRPRGIIALKGRAAGD